MRLFFQPMIGVFIVVATLAPPAHAQGNAVYLATYVEVMPNAVAPGIALLKQYRDASLKEDGNLRAVALAEIERPNRFVVVEAWRDKAALEAHGQSAATLKFRDKLKPIADAPYDERINNALYVTQDREPVRRAFRGQPCRRNSARQGRLHGGAQGDERRYRGRRRQYQLRSAAASQPRQPLHRHRSLDQPQGARRPRHGGAYTRLSRKDQSGCGRALRRAHLQGAELTLGYFCGAKFWLL